MQSELDPVDRRLVSLLQRDAGLSNKELAAAVGLAPSSCHQRIRRLRGSGVVGVSHAEVAPTALGIGLEALVAVRLARHSRELVRTFREHVLALSEVISVYHVAGSHDFLIHVAVRDAEHLRGLTLDAFTTRDEVSRLETSLIFEHTDKHVLPDLASTPVSRP